LFGEIHGSELRERLKILGLIEIAMRERKEIYILLWRIRHASSVEGWLYVMGEPPLYVFFPAVIPEIGGAERDQM